MTINPYEHDWEAECAPYTLEELDIIDNQSPDYWD